MNIYLTVDILAFQIHERIASCLKYTYDNKAVWPIHSTEFEKLIIELAGSNSKDTQCTLRVTKSLKEFISKHSIYFEFERRVRKFIDQIEDHSNHLSSLLRPQVVWK